MVTDGSHRTEGWMTDTAQQIGTKLLERLKEDIEYLGRADANGALARGVAFSLASYNDAAIESYKEALTLDPSCHEAAARLVLLQLCQNQLNEALLTAMKLAAEAPEYELPEMTSDEHISVYTLLGNALVAVGRLDDAIEAYLAARRQSTRDTTAAARLAQLYLAKGQPTEAVEHASAFEGNPRFRSLAGLMSLAATSPALLPSFSDVNVLALCDHGRPLVINGSARLAPLAPDDGGWCEDLPDVLRDDAGRQ